MSGHWSGDPDEERLRRMLRRPWLWPLVPPYPVAMAITLVRGPWNP
jgi:hypothetical protein